MPVAAAIDSLPSDRPHAHARSDVCLKDHSPVSRLALLAWAATRVPGGRRRRASPGLRTPPRRPAAIVLRLGVDRPRPPVPVRSNRRRRVLRANLAAPARLTASARRRCDFRRRRRQARSGASHEVFVPYSTYRPRRVVRRMPATRTIPLRRFRRRPARFCVTDRRRPPVRFCARGELNPGPSECGGSPAVLRARFRAAHFRTPEHRRRSRALVIVARWRDHVHGSSDHISRRRLALPVQGRVIRSGRFSHAAFRTRSSPGSATWPDGQGSSLMPSGGAPGVPPFAGLLPSADGHAVGFPRLRDRISCATMRLRFERVASISARPGPRAC